MAKSKIVLVDFDDTIETKLSKDGTIVFNEKLIKALKDAQKEGAKIIGFTNWFSANYRQGSPSREHILDALKARGLVLDGMNTTYNYLHVYNLVSARKQPGQTHQQYIDDLDENARMNLLNDFYNTKTKPIETGYDYKKGRDENAAWAMAAIETELNNSKVNAKQNMGLSAKLDDLTGGKEEMFRVVMAVLGKHKEYVVFDDKIEVKKVAEALASREGVELHGFFVGEMKALQQGETMPESYDYYKAIINPTLEKNQSALPAKMEVSQALLTSLISKMTSKNKEDIAIRGQIETIKAAFDALNKRCGTAELQGVALAVGQLDGIEQSVRLRKMKIAPSAIADLKVNLSETLSAFDQYHPQAVARREQTPVNGINIDILRGNTSWEGEDCKKVITALNTAAVRVLNNPDADPAEAMSLKEKYEELKELKACTMANYMSFDAKSRQLDNVVVNEHQYRPS